MSTAAIRIAANSWNVKLLTKISTNFERYIWKWVAIQGLKFPQFQIVLNWNTDHVQNAQHLGQGRWLIVTRNVHWCSFVVLKWPSWLILQFVLWKRSDLAGCVLSLFCWMGHETQLAANVKSDKNTYKMWSKRIQYSRSDNKFKEKCFGWTSHDRIGAFHADWTLTTCVKCYAGIIS